MKRSLRLALPLLTCTALLTACPGNGDGGVTPPPPAADTTAPTVALSAIQEGRVVTLSANAQDNVGVTRVDFFIGDTLVTSDTSAPFSAGLNLTTQTGPQNFTAKAYDAAGNVGVGGTQLTVTSSTTLYQGVWGWGLVDANETLIDQGVAVFNEEDTLEGRRIAFGAYLNEAQNRSGYSLLGPMSAAGTLDTAFTLDTDPNNIRFYFIGSDDDGRLENYQGSALFAGGGAVFDAQGKKLLDVGLVLVQVSTEVPNNADAQNTLKAQARAHVARLAAQRPAGLAPLKTSPAALRDVASTLLK